MSSSLLIGVLKSVNSDCEKQMDVDWINLFYHIGMNPKQSIFAVIWLQ